MNKTAIKNFAVWARNKLIDDIAYKAGLLGITEKGIQNPLPQSTKDVQFFDIGMMEPHSISAIEIVQRRKLVETIQKKAEQSDIKNAYRSIVEEVAYTWFNRLIAVRFMEVNGYLPSGIRVLSSESTTKNEPDLVTNPMAADLDFTPYEKDRIVQLIHDNQLDELFRMLFIKQCNALNAILPELFEKTNDYTEILLNIDFTDKEGLVYRLVHDIPEDDFDVTKEGQVEIIGWLYQFYNTEPKNETFALLSKNVKITKERIPSATQLFTPDWIVRYMVENSLGRLWVEGHPSDALKSNWKYYLDEAEQEPEVQKQLEVIQEEYKAIKPEDIKVLDPCMGSGHILVYAFDVLMQIYQSCGYNQSDATKSILENNLYGLDIDDRAYQLAYFAVMMKARQYNRRVLDGKSTCQVYAIQESNGINRDQLKYFGAGMDEMAKNTAILQMEGLLDTFIDAKEYGSLINVESYDWLLLHQFAENVDMSGQIALDAIGIEDTTVQMNRLVEVGAVMALKFNIVITNPPYMSISNGNTKINQYVKRNFPNSKIDFFSVFIERCSWLNQKYGFQAMVTQQSWMFNAVHKKLRDIISQKSIVCLLQLGAHAFDEINGEIVQTATFVIRNSILKEYQSVYLDLTAEKSEKEKEQKLLKKDYFFCAKFEEFNTIPNGSMAYWLSTDARKIFGGKKLGKILTPREGMTTANNDRFLRQWNEINITKIGLKMGNSDEAIKSNKKWFPYNKGGTNRKWYGNCDLVVNWGNDGFEIRNFTNTVTGQIRSHNYNGEYAFSESVTWTAICSGNIMVRFSPAGFLFDSKGASGFCKVHNQLIYCIGLLNSPVSSLFLKVLSPSYEYKVGHVANIPIVFRESHTILSLVEGCINISQLDWDSFETSWEYHLHPLVLHRSYDIDTKKVSEGIEWSYKAWARFTKARFEKLKANEEELNRIYIEIYGLQDELTPEVDDKDITITKIVDKKTKEDKKNPYSMDKTEAIKTFISYAVGCMFGRYSLDVEGLIYAGGEWDGSKYSTFIPDADNVLPITDEKYFQDDIVGRFVAFVRVVYGDDTLEKNLDFIAMALGNRGDTPREVIRNYFMRDFFRDHCKTYKKRPIYWLFDSGPENGFKALIYLHRYDENTIGNLRIDYLHRMQRVSESEIARMQQTIDTSTDARETTAAQKRKDKLLKQLKETKEYDEKIGHLAVARIAIDLDDGVTVNYEKVQTDTEGKKLDVLAKI